MFFSIVRAILLLLAVEAAVSKLTRAADWPMLGRDVTRNPVSSETGAPVDWGAGSFDLKTGRRSKDRGRNLKWVVQLGSLTFGDPVVANGLVWVGTNKSVPVRGYEHRQDASVLMCFRETDGKLLYKYVSRRLPQGRIVDWPNSSLACSPLIDEGRMWFTTNRGEIVCLDIDPLLRSKDKPERTAQDDPRVLWKVDMIKELGVFFRGSPMNICRFSSPAGYKDWIYVLTGNGTDYVRDTIPSPDAPSLLCIEKETGKIVWSDNSPGANLHDGQWASPLVMEIDGQAQCIAPQGDGWLRSFNVVTGKPLWQFDINSKDAVLGRDGEGTRNGILATPILYDGRIYLASGQHPTHLEGKGRLVCIDPTKRGDISSELAVDAAGNKIPDRRKQTVDATKGERAIPNLNSGLIWEFTSGQSDDDFLTEMHRSVTSAAAAEGLVIAVDFSGAVHCLDATTGKRHWAHDLLAQSHAAPLIVDGKVYVADNDGEIAIFGLSADPSVAMKAERDEVSEPIAHIKMGSSVSCSPIFANGVLYIATRTHLFAIEEQKRKSDLPSKVSMGEWKQWRGPGRTNKSPETGLLREWPEGGPPLVWRTEGLGLGIASVSIDGGRIYTTTYKHGMEFAVCLEQRTGKLTWATPIGEAVPENPLMRRLSQRSPTVDDDRLYILSAKGSLVCLSTANGTVQWRKHYVNDFGGRPGWWGFCDYPIVDGDKLICTPAGDDATMVALNKVTGEVIWECGVPTIKELGDVPSYGAVVAIEAGGVRQFVHTLKGSLVGIAADGGKLLWRHQVGIQGSRFSFNALTPLVQGDRLFCVGDRGGVAALLTVVSKAGNFLIREQYSIPPEERLNTFQDHLILVDDHVFASASVRRDSLMCLDLKTGQPLWHEQKPRTDRHSRFLATTYAEGHIYIRSATGEVRLVEASPSKYIEKGSFVILDHEPATGATTPVIAGGHLYLRNDDRIFAYDIRREALEKKRPEPSTVTIDLPNNPLRVIKSDGEQQTRPGPRSVFVPTPQDVVEKMLELAEVKKDDVVYDLGSGDGRIVIAAAKKYGSRAIGIEIDPELVEVSRTKAADAGVGELVAIKQQDIFKTDLSKANVVAVYLLPKQLEKLIPQLERLPNGARIVSHQFEIPGIQPTPPVRVRSEGDGAVRRIYLWRAPLKRRP